VPTQVLKQTADHLGTDWSERPTADNERGTQVAIGTIASGTTHDGCLFHLTPASVGLKEVLVPSVLRLQSSYIGGSMNQAAVLRVVLGPFAT
jgi:hypothetical protein